MPQDHRDWFLLMRHWSFLLHRLILWLILCFTLLELCIDHSSPVVVKLGGIVCLLGIEPRFIWVTISKHGLNLRCPQIDVHVRWCADITDTISVCHGIGPLIFWPWWPVIACPTHQTSLFVMHRLHHEEMIAANAITDSRWVVDRTWKYGAMTRYVSDTFSVKQSWVVFKMRWVMISWAQTELRWRRLQVLLSCMLIGLWLTTARRTKCTHVTESYSTMKVHGEVPLNAHRLISYACLILLNMHACILIVILLHLEAWKVMCGKWTW